MVLLDGKSCSEQLRQEIDRQTIARKSNATRSPRLEAALLSRKHDPGTCSKSIALSRTRDIGKLWVSTDTLVTANDKPKTVAADMVKQGPVGSDITRIVDDSMPSASRLVGDVDLEAVKGKRAFVTPITAGVGPMTRASLLQNTPKAHLRQ